MIAGGRGGSIIVVGSIMAEFNHPTSSTYTSSKVRKTPSWPRSGPNFSL